MINFFRRLHAAVLLKEALARQPRHEIEYEHMGGPTSALRVETVARRVERMLYTEGRKPPRELREMVRRALCQPGL